MRPQHDMCLCAQAVAAVLATAWLSVCAQVGELNQEECGIEDTRSFSTPLIMSGNKVERNQFPWQVAIFQKKLEEPSVMENICGGSLISLRFVVSAAHCFYEENPYPTPSRVVPATDFRVVAGSRHRAWNSTELGQQDSEVLEVHLGEKFGGMARNWQDDIAVLLLASQLRYSDTVRPVCLDLTNKTLYEGHVRVGSVGVVAGWGLTEKQIPSETLNFLRLSIIDDRNCSEDAKRIQYSQYMTSDKLCAGNYNESTVCQGDSGGGLVFSNSEVSDLKPRYYLRGLVSNKPRSLDSSILCLSGYALFTDVFLHRDWLSQKISELQSKIKTVCTVKEAGKVDRAGVCRLLADCPRALELTKKSILPQVCAEGDRVCCDELCEPLPHKTSSKATNYCIELAEQMFPCKAQGAGGGRCPAPDFPSTVFSNTPLPIAEIPHYAKLGTGTRKNISWWCRAALISARWVLGAAKCVETYGPMQFVRLGGGIERRFTAGDTFSVSRQVVHPDYRANQSLIYNDISLLEMDTAVNFTSSVMPACLHTRAQLPEGLHHVGWSNALMNYGKTTVDPISHAQCAEVFPVERKYFPDGVRAATQVCLRPRNPDSGCPSYYSGSPLQAASGRVPCMQQLVGLSSAWKQQPCTRMFVRVAPFVPWIEGYVWP